MKEAVIRMETTARPTTDRSASPRLLKGLLLAITLVALLATTVILCQQDIENPSYVYMTKVCIMDGYTSKQQMVLKIGKKYSAFIHNKDEMSVKTLIMWMIEYGWLSD